MASPITRASSRVLEFMNEQTPGAFISDGELFEYAYLSAIQAVREEYAKDARARRERKRRQSYRSVLNAQWRAARIEAGPG